MTATRPYLERASRKAEARFFYLSALRELGSHDEYVAQTRALVTDFPGDSWSEEALNNLGTHYIVTNEDEAAAQVFAELYEKFPTGSRAERAAWKSGWWSYRKGDYQNAVRTFESAARLVSALGLSAVVPVLGGTGARGARAGRGRGGTVPSGLHDYGSSYYGRLAQKHASRERRRRSRRIGPSRRPSGTPRRCAAAADRRSHPQLLLANGLYDDALEELRFAQRQWGTSPAIEATIAWAYHQKGSCGARSR